MSAEHWAVLDGFGGENVVAIRPSLIRLVGAPAAIWLSQALFYQRRMADDQGRFQVKQEKIELETGLSAESQKSARDRLVKMGLLEELRGVGNRLHYRVKLEALVAALRESPKREFKKLATDENQEKPESGKPGIREVQKPDIPESGNSRNQNPENTGNQNPENPETTKEEDPFLRSFSKTPTTIPTELSVEGEHPDSSREIAGAAAEKKSDQTQTSNTGQTLESPPAPEGATDHDGGTRTGGEDIPGAAPALDAARLEASQALEAYLGSTRCREKYPTDHAQYLEGRAAWFELRRPEFILECIRCARNGTGVEKSPYGALVKWLEFPASAPDSARELELRLERGLSPRLERVPRRWYRTGDGLEVFVERWQRGEALLEGGSRTALQLTRLWTLLPDGYTPEIDNKSDSSSAQRPIDRVNPETIAAGLKRLGLGQKVTTT